MQYMLIQSLQELEQGIMYQYILLLALAALTSAQEEYCYSSDPEPYGKLGVYTSYSGEVQNPGDSPLQFDGCSPVSFWAFSRHGSRNPEEEQVSDFLVLHFFSRMPPKSYKIIVFQLFEFTNFGQDVQDLVAANFEQRRGMQYKYLTTVINCVHFKSFSSRLPVPRGL